MQQQPSPQLEVCSELPQRHQLLSQRLQLEDSSVQHLRPRQLSPQPKPLADSLAPAQHSPQRNLQLREAYLVSLNLLQQEAAFCKL